MIHSSIIVACKRLAAVFDYDVAANPTGTVGESAFLCVAENKQLPTSKNKYEDNASSPRRCAEYRVLCHLHA